MILHDGRWLWYLNRGTGFVLLALLTASVALGVLATARTSSERWPRFVTQGLHRNASLLALGLLAAHASTSIMDEYVDLRWWAAIVPFGAGYRPFWLALGTLGCDLMLLVTITSLARRWMSLRNWRAIHLSSYLAWLLGVIHGLGIGTDVRAVWSVGITAGSVGVVAGALAVRLAAVSQERKLGARG